MCFKLDPIRDWKMKSITKVFAAPIVVSIAGSLRQLQDKNCKGKYKCYS